jgi:lipopolysaccharide heptosyltransferase I
MPSSNSAALRIAEFGRILLIKFSALGDVVQSIPVAHKLRRRYPAAEIDWLVRPAFADLLAGHPAVDNVIAFPRQRFLGWPGREHGSRVSALAQLLSGLRSRRYDLVIDLQGQLRSALLALATGAPVRIGFDRPRPELRRRSNRTLPAEAWKHCWQGAREGAWIAYSHRIELPTIDLHAVDRYLCLGPMLGLNEDPPDFSFDIPADALARAEALLADPGAGRALKTSARPIVLAPATRWETKHWQSEGFRDVARHFVAQGRAVVLIGSAEERAVCETIAAAAPGTLNLAGSTSVPELAALLRRCAVCVTNDSGPMHLAVALDRPVVSIFGPSDPLWIGPYHRPDAVIRAGLACSPCYLRELSRCPYDHACMRQIAGATVIERVEAMLAAADCFTLLPAAAAR